MELGPIFRALTHHKSRFWLIALEIALTLAIVVNCLTMVLDVRRRVTRPTGMDEDNVLVVRSQPFAPEFKDKDYVQTSYQQDLRVLRAIPGVHQAEGIDYAPLSGNGSNSAWRTPGAHNELVIGLHKVGAQVVETLGLELIAGRDFVDSDFPSGTEETEGGSAPRMRNVILTKFVADRFFPDGRAVGQKLEGGPENTVVLVVGVVARMQWSWPDSPEPERVMLIPGRPADSQVTIYLVRAQPGMVDGLYTRVEKELLAANAGRILSARTLHEVKVRTYRDQTAVAQMLGALGVLLVFVTSMGIVGLTSFSVTQRTREIGTRRALGASRAAILRFFLVENWMITSAGLSLGLGLTYGLNFALARLADVRPVALWQVATGMLLLWVAGLLAALAPALRGASVPPVVATRTV